MVRANLVEDSSAQLRQSKAFASLDPSEKGAVSYFLGLVFTKLIAEKLFGVSWILHLDVYKTSLEPKLELNGKSDFVGVDQFNRWIVIESKGRTNGAPSSLLDKAKYQTRCLREIAGTLPTLRVALASYFSSERLRFKIRDPEGYEPDAKDLSVKLNDFIREYYRPLYELINTTSNEVRERDSRKYIRADLSGLDASVNIDDELISRYASGEILQPQLLDWLPQAPPVLDEVASRQNPSENGLKVALEKHETKEDVLGAGRLKSELPVGYDGVFIELGNSWSPEYMRREPHERGK